MSTENEEHLTQGTPHQASRSSLARPAATLSHPMGEGHLPSAEKGSEVAVEPYINKREVARRLNRTVRCVDNMMRRGMLPYYKLGYRVAFRWSEIQNHLAQTCRVCRS